MCRDGDPYDGVHGMPEPGLNPPKVLLYRKLFLVSFHLQISLQSIQ